MIFNCIDRKKFEEILISQGFIVRNGKFVFDLKGNLITEIDKDIYIPPEYSQLANLGVKQGFLSPII